MKNTQLKRIIAFVLDTILIGIASRMFENLYSPLITSEDYNVFGFVVTVSISSALLFYAVYFFLFDLTNHGVTLGKHLMKIKVTNKQSIELSSSRLVKRTCLKLIGIIILPISAIVFLVSNGKTLHDHIFKTCTISNNKR